MSVRAFLLATCTLLLAATGGIGIAAVDDVRDAAAPVQDIAQLNHAVFTTRDGAPPDIIHLVEGHDGFLWLATSTGLARFDGMRFEIDPVEGFPKRGVYTVASDRGGDLWAGLQSGGLARVRDGHVTLFEPPVVPAGTVFEILRLRDGVLWVVSANGVARLVGDRWEIADASMGYVPDRPTGTSHVSDDVLMIEDRGRVVAIHAGEAMFRDATREDYLRASLQLGPHDPWDFARPETDGIRDAAGTNWIVAESGIDRYHWRPGQAPRIEHVGKREGLTSDDVSGVRHFASGNTWVWTDFGLERFRANRMTRLIVPRDPALPAMERDAKDGIWVSSPTTPVLYHATARGVTAFERGKGVGVMTLAPDGTLWMAGRDGLEYRRGEEHGRIPLPDDTAGVGAQSFQSICVDRDEVVWVHILRYGVYAYSGGRWTRVLGPDESAPMRMVADGSGRRWQLYGSNRVTVTDGDATTSYGAEANVDVGRALAIDVGGPTVWIGGRTGVQFLRGQRFETLVTAADDALTGVTGLVATPSGELWANGNRGLARVAREDIEASLRDPAHVNPVHWFDFNDGIDGVAGQVRPLPTLVRSVDGRLWASTNRGVFWIDPDTLAPDTRRLDGVATALFADGQRIEPRGVAQVPEFTHAVQIEYTAPDLSTAPRIRFRYRLDGFEKDWQDAGSRRTAIYTALGPGDYVFHLSVANADGIWSEGKPVLAFRLQAGWYQTGLFKAGCALLGLALLAALLNLRDRRAAMRRRVRMAERERIARELHDTLLQGTQGLIFHVGSALKKTSEPALRIALIDAMERAQDSLVELRERVSALRESDRSPVDFVELLQSAAMTIVHGHDVHFAMEVGGSPRLLAASAAAELATVCQEGLSNVVAHAGARSILLRLVFRRRWFTITIADDGAGIEEPVLRAGGRAGHWGLLGMRERVDFFQGRIGIEPRRGGGTLVTIRVRGPRVYAR